MVMVSEEPVLVWTTERGAEVIVEHGKKKESLFDFRVRFREPKKRVRTPAHAHLIVDMLLKLEHDAALTLELRNYVLNLFHALEPIDYFPPTLQVFDYKHVSKFKTLDAFGMWDVELLLVLTELLLIQEKTNYPKGSLTVSLYKSIGGDAFTVIQQAVRGRL